MVKAADEYTLMTNIYKEFRLESALIKLTPMSFGSITYNTGSKCSCAIMEILGSIEALDYGQSNSSPSPQAQLRDRTVKTLTPMFALQYNGNTSVMVPTNDVGNMKFTWINDYKDDNSLFESTSSD